MKIEDEAKKMIEENPVALATTDNNGNSHVIAVSFVKINGDNIVITDNYMDVTIKNLNKNPKVSLAVWNSKMIGYGIDGVAKYFDSGKWLDFVKSIKQNKNESCKGAIVIEIKQMRKLA